MRLQTIARRLPDEVWTAFEPVLPPVVWKGEGRPSASNHACRHGLLYVLVIGIRWEYVPPCFPSVRRRPPPAGRLAGGRRLPRGVAAVGRAVRGVAGGEPGPGTHRWLQEAGKIRGRRHRPQPRRPWRVLHRRPHSDRPARGHPGGGGNGRQRQRRGADRGRAGGHGPPAAAPGPVEPVARPPRPAAGAGGWRVRQRPEPRAGAAGRPPPAGPVPGGGPAAGGRPHPIRHRAGARLTGPVRPGRPPPRPR